MTDKRHQSTTPAHPIAAMPLVALDLVALDTETTGLEVSRDRIVQIGAVRMRGAASGTAPEAQDTLDLKVNPDIAIPPASTRIHHLSVRGEDPIRMLSAPIPATRYAMEKSGMSLDDIDLVEINEAFAPVVCAWAKELDVDLAKVNVNGGAIALGHPLGATGAKLMTTLLHELERTGGRYGLQTMGEGGGQANVTIIERLD